MNTSEVDKVKIDDLLEKFSPELLTSYQDKHLGGKSLWEVNSYYSRLSQKRSKLYNWLLAPRFGAAGVAIIFFLMSLYAAINDTGNAELFAFVFGVSSIIMLVPTLITIVFDLIVGRSMIKNKRILNWFQEAVKSLTPSGLQLREYTAESIRESLVAGAWIILEAEERLDKICLNKSKDVISARFCCDRILNCRERLGVSLDQALSFGLEFSKKDLFLEAQKRRSN